MNALVESVIFAAYIAAPFFLLAALAATADLLVRHPEPPRPSGENFDYLTPTKDFFHGNDRVRLSMALARNETAAARVESPAAMTSKEIHHAGRQK